MKFADRLNRLGTETAFAVAATATEWVAKGNEVFPFHLGDLNLPTPENISAAMHRAVSEGKTGYCPNAGITPLRAALAQSLGKQRNVLFTPENIAVQPGGKPVIGKFLRSVMNPGDEVLYPNPGFPIYESQIEFNDGIAVAYRYLDTPNGFQIDLDYLESKITPKTKALIINDQQNPLAAEMTDAEREKLANLANTYNLWVLSDEAYFDIRYAGESKSIVSLPGMQDRTVILYTFSKKFAMTGWRLGAAIGPKEIVDRISRLNTNEESCTAQFVQWAGVEAINGDQSGAHELVRVLKTRRDATIAGIQTVSGMRVHTPNSAFYVFPEVSETMARTGHDDLTRFALDALHNSGMSFCTRRHFGRPVIDEKGNYIRLAYSGIDSSQIDKGLSRLAEWVNSK
ncbi:MAG: aminotransferase class I/II-fold pyridoxal phosphate-dependent enzyme [Acidimicrobiaceae bacterium]|nr:aminotransferase class I/II-fold pyridoxal phosphate-dependent enzyme [Acidimicrobiaceae bacterium]